MKRAKALFGKHPRAVEVYVPTSQITDNRSTATCKESRGHLRNKFKISLVIVTSDGFEDVITFNRSSPWRKSH